jgi:hypothetical protein
LDFLSPKNELLFLNTTRSEIGTTANTPTLLVRTAIASAWSLKKIPAMGLYAEGKLWDRNKMCIIS